VSRKLRLPRRVRWLDLVVLAAAGLLVIQAPASVAAAGWVSDLEVLPRIAIAGLIAGYLLERTRAPAVVSLPLGMLLGAEAVLYVFARVAAPGESLQAGVNAVSGRVGSWLDTVGGGGISNDPLVFAVAMAGLAWLLGEITAWLLFRDDAAWVAIIFNGVALLMNLSYASTSLTTGYVSWFAFSACLLLAAQQLANRTELWRRAQLRVPWRIVLNVLIGTGLAAGALLSVAWALPTNVTSPEVASGWGRATAPWQGLEEGFDRWFAALNGNDRNARGLSFGRTLAPRGAFDLGDTPVLQIRANGPLYLRATTADRYAGQAITSSETSTTSLDAAQDLVPQEAIPNARAAVSAEVTVLASRTSVAFAPDAPLRFSQSAEVDTRGTPDDIATIRLDQPVQQNQKYTVVSAVSTATAQELRAAGEVYPDWVRQRFLQLPRRMPRRVVDLAHEAAAGSANPYDKAIALESYLRDNFTYSTHVPTVPPDQDWVDFFLFESREGYCDYFATAMTVLLRVEGVPARVASGFAPGDFDPSTGISEVRENDAHTWVEAYFPRYGWITFEPSSIRPIPARFEEAPQAEAAPVPTPPEGSDRTGLTPEELDELLGLEPGGQAGAAPPRPFFTTLPGVVLLLGLLLLFLAAIGGGLLAVAWRRGMGTLQPYQRPYARLVRLGQWSGALKPRSSDTPFELANVLGRQVPRSREAIESMTAAYVEGTYAARQPTTDPLPAWLAARRDIFRAMLRRRLRRWLGDSSTADAVAHSRPDLLSQWGASASRRNRSTRSK
jgi:transglutaminase-like putative cysteine protease